MNFSPSCRVDVVHSDGSNVAPKDSYKVEDHHKPGSVGAEVGHMHACSEPLRMSGGGCMGCLGCINASRNS